MDDGIRSLLPGAGIFNAEGEEWRSLRKLTSPAFTKRIIETCGAAIDAHMARLVGGWSSANEGIVDPLAGCLRTTLHIILQLVFGVDAAVDPVRNDFD